MESIHYGTGVEAAHTDGFVSQQTAIQYSTNPKYSLELLLRDQYPDSVLVPAALLLLRATHLRCCYVYCCMLILYQVSAYLLCSQFTTCAPQHHFFVTFQRINVLWEM